MTCSDSLIHHREVAIAIHPDEQLADARAVLQRELQRDIGQFVPMTWGTYTLSLRVAATQVDEVTRYPLRIVRMSYQLEVIKHVQPQPCVSVKGPSEGTGGDSTSPSHG